MIYLEIGFIGSWYTYAIFSFSNLKYDGLSLHLRHQQNIKGSKNISKSSQTK